MKDMVMQSFEWEKAYVKYVKENTLTQRLFITALMWLSLFALMMHLKVGLGVIICLSFLGLSSLALVADFCLSLLNISPVVKENKKETLLEAITLRTERQDFQMLEIEARSRELVAQIASLQAENQELSKKAHARHLEIRAEVEKEVEPLLDSSKVMGF